MDALESASVGRISLVRVGGIQAAEIRLHADLDQSARVWALVTVRSARMDGALALAGLTARFLVTRGRLLHGLDDTSARLTAAAAWGALRHLYGADLESSDHDTAVCFVRVGRHRLNPDGDWSPEHPADLPFLPWPAEEPAP